MPPASPVSPGAAAKPRGPRDRKVADLRVLGALLRTRKRARCHSSRFTTIIAQAGLSMAASPHEQSSPPTSPVYTSIMFAGAVFTPRDPGAVSIDDAFHNTTIITERMTTTPVVGGQQPRNQLPLSITEEPVPRSHCHFDSIDSKLRSIREIRPRCWGSAPLRVGSPMLNELLAVQVPSSEMFCYLIWHLERIVSSDRRSELPDGFAERAEAVKRNHLCPLACGCLLVENRGLVDQNRCGATRLIILLFEPVHGVGQLL